MTFRHTTVLHGLPPHQPFYLCLSQCLLYELFDTKHVFYHMPFWALLWVLRHFLSFMLYYLQSKTACWKLMWIVISCINIVMQIWVKPNISLLYFVAKGSDFYWYNTTTSVLAIKYKLSTILYRRWSSVQAVRSIEAATAVLELLMMGVRTSETCWAVHKRQIINLRNCCI
jgi:hypothetical protein